MYICLRQIYIRQYLIVSTFRAMIFDLIEMYVNGKVYVVPENVPINVAFDLAD